MQQIGVIFFSKRLKTKKGNEYYSGRLEGSQGFNLMAFVKTAKSGTKYLSLVEVEDRQAEDKQGEIEEKPTENNPIRVETKVKSNEEQIIDPDDLPF